MKIAFFGDSITQNFKLLDNHENVVNLGRSGDKITDLICRFFSLMDELPDRIFLMIGVNDFLVSKGYWQKKLNIDIVSLYMALLALLRDNIPHKDIYLLSILPINIASVDNYLWNHEIDVYNLFFEGQAKRLGYKYLDLAKHFKDEQNNMNIAYSGDGVHLTEAGYQLYYDLIKELL